MAAVIHHGGAGTTGAALRAGVPSLVVPFAADQPFWGERTYALGVGPRLIPRRRLTAENLAEAVRIAVTDPGMRERASLIGSQIQAEDGVARAVEVFERHVAAPRVVSASACAGLNGGRLVLHPAHPQPHAQKSDTERQGRITSA